MVCRLIIDVQPHVGWWYWSVCGWYIRNVASWKIYTYAVFIAALVWFCVLDDCVLLYVSQAAMLCGHLF
jgi:hypothetical protein